MTGSVLLLGLLALGSLPGVRVSGGSEQARALVEARLVPAAAAVEQRLGPIGWQGLTVTLIDSSLPVSASVPDWAPAWAVPDRDAVVLRLDRIGSYPHQSLDQVLIHELAHIATHRLARGRDVPRWLDEGLAMSVARELGPRDAYQLSLALVFGGADLEDFESRFRSSSAEAQAAYALSLSLVRHIEDRAGVDVGRRVLARLARDQPFEAAFAEETGLRLEALVAEWQREAAILYRWIPLVTSGVTLWIGITLLALVAFARVRQRRREIEARWALEEAEAAWPRKGADADGVGPYGPH